tara:strand:+ start:124 stop:861 length:738 start_codon:yes stop_codon:yes gene_type:complete
MKIIDLEIYDISLNGGNSGAYVMVLVEKGGERKIPILIGGSEAQYIAIELENMKPSRPLTHDLFKSTLTSFDMTVTEVVIFDYKEGVFFAKIMVTDGEKIVEVDSRSSDAVAIAVRFRAPIRCYESVLKTTGITPAEEAELNQAEEEEEFEEFVDEFDDDDDHVDENEDDDEFEGFEQDLEVKEIVDEESSSIEDVKGVVDMIDEDLKKRKILELQKNLNEAIRNEDYESASQIRDNIEKINSES